MSNINHIDKVNLENGVRLLKNRGKYHSMIGDRRLNLIKKSTTKELGSFIEGMENMNDDELPYNQQTQKLNDLQDEFNNLLDEYTKTYEDYIEEVTGEKQNPDIRNVNITGRDRFGGPDNNDYYIRMHLNNFGYVRRYDSSRHWVGPAGANTAHQRERERLNCPVPFQNRRRSLEIYDRMKTGVPLVTGEPCNLEGKMVRNEKNNAVSWVRPDGRLMGVPSRDLFNQLKENGCPSEITNLPESVYNNMTRAGTMKATDTCSTLLHSPLHDKLTNLNRQLIAKAQEIYDEVSVIEDSNVGVRERTDKIRNTLLGEIKKLNDEREELNKDNDRVITYEKEYYDSNKQITSSYYEYVFWILIVLGIGTFTIRQITKK